MDDAEDGGNAWGDGTMDGRRFVRVREQSTVPATENESPLGAANLHVIHTRVGSSPDASEYRRQNEPRQPSTACSLERACYRLHRAVRNR